MPSHLTLPNVCMYVCMYVCNLHFMPVAVGRMVLHTLLSDPHIKDLEMNMYLVQSYSSHLLCSSALDITNIQGHKDIDYQYSPLKTTTVYVVATVWIDTVPLPAHTPFNIIIE